VSCHADSATDCAAACGCAQGLACHVFVQLRSCRRCVCHAAWRSHHSDLPSLSAGWRGRGRSGGAADATRVKTQRSSISNASSARCCFPPPCFCATVCTAYFDSAEALCTWGHAGEYAAVCPDTFVLRHAQAQTSAAGSMQHARGVTWKHCADMSSNTPLRGQGVMRRRGTCLSIRDANW
jgi:hypothetical protein